MRGSAGERPRVERETRAAPEPAGAPGAGGDVFCLIDATGAIIYASPSMESAFGVHAGNLLDIRMVDSVHRDDRDPMAASWQRVVSRPGLQTEAHFRVEDGEGGWRSVLVVSTNLLDTPGVGAVVLNFHDVSEELAAAERLRVSEARLRSIIEHTTDGLILVDEDARIGWASPAAEDVMGHPLETMLGSSVLDYVHPDDLETAIPALLHTMEGVPNGLPTLLRARHADGGWRWVEAVAKQVESDTDQGAMFSLRDVTARVAAEAAVRQSEIRYRTVVQNSYDVVAVIDTVGVIQWVTPNVSTLLGWDPADLEGHNGLDYIHPDDLDHMISQLAEYEARTAVPVPVTVQMRHRDGSWHHVEMVATDFLDHPDIGGIALSLRVVDERMAVELDRKRLTEIFELSSDMVVTMEVDGTLVYLNAAGRRFIGMAPDDPLGLFPLTTWVGPRHIDRLATEVPKAVLEHNVWTGEIEFIDGEGRLVPVLVQIVGHRDRDDRLRYVSAISRDISERKALETRLAHEATHDPLTGLPNRTMLLNRLGAALARGRRQEKSVAVLFCDLDNFKVVNDSMGHGRGDQLLTLVARRLQDVLRPEDTVGRFGGDEFVILCEDIDGPEDAGAVAKRVEHAFNGAFTFDGHEMFVGVSIGIAMAVKGEADPESLVRDADAAMYGAKNRGRSRFQFFEPAMWERAVGRFDLENALRGALGRHEFELHFQPISTLAGAGRTVAVEGLLRWRHPERGLLLPEEFIPVAEETGLIVPIGAWVVETACRTLRAWQEGGPALANVDVAVNISARQLQHPDFAEAVAASLEAAGLEARFLHLEITESVLMHDVEQSQEVLGRLKAIGVQLAVDDFGTGYSSLSYLRRFPVDSLKVDRSFVDGLGTEAEDSAIVAAIVNLAHTLGLVAVAEGVETLRQRHELERLGCDLFQGHLLSPALPADELEAAMAAL